MSFLDNRNPNLSREVRTLVVAGRARRIGLETYLWEALEEIGRREEFTIPEVLDRLASQFSGESITGVLRLFIIRYYENAASVSGSTRHTLAETGPEAVAGVSEHSSLVDRALADLAAPRGTAGTDADGTDT